MQKTSQLISWIQRHDDKMQAKITLQEETIQNMQHRIEKQDVKNEEMVSELHAFKEQCMKLENDLIHAHGHEVQLEDQISQLNQTIHSLKESNKMATQLCTEYQTNLNNQQKTNVRKTCLFFFFFWVFLKL